MKKSEEKTGKEKYKLWWILDHSFEKDKTDKSGISNGKTAFAVGVTATMIALLAFAGSAAAQGGDWPYDWDPMAWDADDPGMEEYPYNAQNDAGVYYMDSGGFQLPIKTIASNPQSYDVQVVYGGNVVAEQHISGTGTEPREFLIDVPNGPLGEYEIQIKNGPVTDRCQVRDIGEIPEFPTIALPAAAIIGLFFLLRHRGSKKVG